MVRAFVVFGLCLWRLVDAVSSVSVMEGDSVALNTGVTEVQNYYLIHWVFRETRIAEINNLTKSSSIYNTDDDKTLRDRLQLDPQTGSLTITNTRTTDSGLYQLILTSEETRSKNFSVTVSVLNPSKPKTIKGLCQRATGNIRSTLQKHTSATTTQSSSSPEGSASSSCVSSSCAVNNSAIKHTENLSPDCIRYCGTLEAVIRLVVAAVVGVAAVAVLVYDIRSTRSEQHGRDITVRPME
ncbi:uncharacterized protein LOC131530800 isoform X1 [Onychostoma macrolepis]|uniref:uncharacterized protein LOC131530800 isoform X1 n=1 Tax=Onychostoma macrolepis TaxID=369639 RepID=UPI0027299C7E|nr:uncharacterized protein LOC131530800 isoform X1 [Onychostoma macrolepis]